MEDKNIDSDNNIKLDEFNLSEFYKLNNGHLSNFLILGYACSGKTTLIKNFMIELKQNDIINDIILFVTEDNDYLDIISQPRFINYINFNNLESITNTIKNIMEEQIKLTDTKIKPKLLIFDNSTVCFPLSPLDKQIDPDILDLIENPNKYNIILILTSEMSFGYYKYRCKFKNIIIFKETCLTEKHKLHTHYLKEIITFT